MKERIQQHIADVHTLYVAFHNYHWHVKGIQFKAIHELTESYYEWLAELYDDLAERLLMMGETPPVTIAAYQAMTKIKEEERTEFSPQEVLKKVLEAFSYLSKELEITRQEASEGSDSVTDDLLTEALAFLQKQIWFVRSSL